MSRKHPRPQPLPNCTAMIENPWVPLAARIQNIQRELPDTSTYALQFTDSDIANNY